MAPELAALVVLFQGGLGLPLSWKKVRLNASPQWIGLVFHFNCGRIVIPCDKINRIVEFLRTVINGPRRVERRSIEQGTGLMLWITEVHLALRPWISEFYTTLSATTVTLVSMTAQQYSDLLPHLSSKLAVTPTCTQNEFFQAGDS